MSLRWVEAGGALAIVVHDAGNGALLIRYAKKRGGYHWVNDRSVRRRPDLAAHPEPVWLARARDSSRPPRILWPLLHDTWPPPPMFDTDADGRPLQPRGEVND